ncbi:MAG: response regulator [Epsilonproteobacteria bacterium]|nr:response regulator [Campylobacterota bacterium]
MHKMLKIVIVDDSTTSCKILEKLLRKIGYENITYFTSPLEYVKYLKGGNKADIVFIDYQMPDMDGLEVLKFTKDFDKNILCVIITSSTDATLKEKAVKLGVNEFMQKDIDFYEFKVKVEILANLKRYYYEIKATNKRLRDMYQKVRDSLNYALLIQHMLLPNIEDVLKFFKDAFALWLPKDVVGGDIWSYIEINKDESVLMCIDCTGHGVPGAFVTMMVKAIEKEVKSELLQKNMISYLHKEAVSPADILAYFNKSIKTMLQHYPKDDQISIGFDGGVLYVNKKEKIAKYSGANTPLFYSKDGKIEILKGDRHSVGCKKCNINHVYKEHTLPLEENQKFFMSTDGFLDQIGGKKHYPFGKKRFKKVLESYLDKDMKTLQAALLLEYKKWKGNNEVTDDITVLGVEV